MRTRIAAAAAVLSLIALAACGGGDDDTTTATPDDDTVESEESTADSTTDDDTGASTGETDASTSTDAGDVESAPSDTATGGNDTSSPDTGSGSYEPGDIDFRVVNLLADPVDIYVRTMGLVEAFEAELGVAPGAVTEMFAPPADGRLIVTTAGSGDPTCVGSCDHFLAELGGYPEQGDTHTLVLYDEGGLVRGLDLWESPEPAEGTANALAAADPASGQVIPVSVAVTDADFGMRLAIVGIDGCRDPANMSSDILVGGNQTPSFVYDDDEVEVVLHDNQDRDCAETPVGGPFTVTGGPGTRSLLVLTGSPGSLDAMIVPLTGDVEPSTDPPGSETASGADRDLAVSLMATEIENELLLPPDQAECAAGLLVDGIGPDVLLDGDQLVDLDGLGPEVDEAAATALLEAVTECEIDPAIFGG